MKKIIEYPTDAPLVDHPLYAFTIANKPKTLIEALCAFYGCEQDDLKGKFKGDRLSTHKYAFNVAWQHLCGSNVGTPTAKRADEIAQCSTPDTTPAARAARV